MGALYMGAQYNYTVFSTGYKTATGLVMLMQSETYVNVTM